MNYGELVMGVWDNLGRPSDLSPLTNINDDTTINNTTNGFLIIGRWLNTACETITKWKTPQGRYQRFDDIIARKILTTGPYVLVNATATVGSKVVTLDPLDNNYVGFVPPTTVLVYISTGSGSGFSTLAYFTDDHTLVLFTEMSADYDGTSVLEIRERGYYYTRVLTANRPYAFRAIRVLSELSEVELAARIENFTGSINQSGQPSEYFKEKAYLFFDKALDQDYILELEYDDEIIAMVDLIDVPVIALVYHTPMMDWATAQGYKRAGDLDESYKLTRTFDTGMRGIFMENEKNIARVDGGFTS